MQRRRYLALVATSTLGGCLADAPSAGPTATTEGSPTVAMGESVVTDAGFEVTVSAPSVQRFLVTLDVGSSVHPDVAGFADEQFLVVTVEVDATDRAGTVTPADVHGSVRAETGNSVTDYPPYRSSGAEDRFALRYPVRALDDAAVVWVHNGDVEARWRLDETTRRALERAPSFAVRRFDAPESVQRGEPFDAQLTLANTGDRGGTFVAEFGDQRLISDVGEVAVDVPTGTEVARTLPYEPPYWEGVEEITLQLDWAIDDLTRTVRVTD